MEEVKNESKNEVEETTTQIDSTEEVKTEQPEVDESATQKTEEADKQVTLSEKELETLQKKAQDFENMTRTKRGQKLLDKMRTDKDPEEDEESQPAFDPEQFKAEVLQEAEERARNIVDANKGEEMRDNVASTYETWIKDNNWANDDETFKTIFAEIKPTNSSKKEVLLAELDRAAFSAHPLKYREAMENRIKSKILMEQNKIDVGSGGGTATSVRKDDVDVTVTKEDQTIIDKYFGGDVERYLKTKK